MIKHKTIEVFEHQRLTIGEQGFKQRHLDAILKLNELHEGKYFEPIAKGIKFNQYVGVIQVDGLTIEIHPKSDKYDDDKKWQGVLIKMLKACGRLGAETLGMARVKRQNLNLLEVYFELYLRELEVIIRRGLVKKYRKETSNDNVLKGKLEFSDHLNKNLIHKERFYTTHQVYDANHLLHQILYNALDIVGQFTKGTRLFDMFKRVELNFPNTSQVRITKQVLNSITLNRKTKDYSYALELARLIILNYSPDISAGNEKMLSLLFDMNELWEEYVLKQLRKESAKYNIEVFGQESKSFWGSNSLRPDIVIRKDDKTYIIDTKWKRPKNSTASVGDLRQIYTYCRFWDAQKALLLYPGTNVNHNFNSYLTDDYSCVGSDMPNVMVHQCKMGFVSVIDENGDLDQYICEKIIYQLEM